MEISDKNEHSFTARVFMRIIDKKEEKRGDLVLLSSVVMLVIDRMTYFFLCLMSSTRMPMTMTTMSTSPPQSNQLASAGVAK